MGSVASRLTSNSPVVVAALSVAFGAWFLFRRTKGTSKPLTMSSEQGLVVQEGGGYSVDTGSAEVAALKEARRKLNDSADDGADGADVGDLRGLPRGGVLGAGRYLFRGQVFWQQILPEQVASAQLEFSMGIGEDGRNYARIPATPKGNPSEPADDAPQLIRAAVCVPSGREDEVEVTKVMRGAAGWGQHIQVRRLLARAFVTSDACSGALCEAAKSGHELVVQELLRAKASPCSDDGAAKKTALHFACEEGHEGAARLLLEAKADLSCQDATGRTPCELARDQELGMMAKRLEKDFK